MTMSTVNLLDAVTSLVHRTTIDSEHDEVATAITMMDRLKAEVKALDTLLKGATIEWIKVNEQNIRIGDVRYYVTTEKKTTCPDNGFAFSACLLRSYGMKDFEDLLETSLAESGGDVAATAERIQDAVMGAAGEVLGAGAIKPGAAKKILGEEDFPRFFKVEEVTVLEKGKPEPVKKEVLVAENENFLPPEVRRARAAKKRGES